MFYGCNNLETLDLSNVNTSIVENMAYMFAECYNLTSLNLSNFNTSTVKDMTCMFCSCRNLKSLDLSNFDTSSVTSMRWMFSGCNNLMSLDLTSFNTSLVTSMGYMFVDCQNLISLDLRNFNTFKLTEINGIVYSINSNIVVCLLPNSQSYIWSEFSSLDINCSHICFLPEKKIIYDENKCTLNCSINSLYVYNNICYAQCPEGTKLSPSNNYQCIKHGNKDIQTELIISEINTFNVILSNSYSSNELTDNVIHSSITTETDAYIPANDTIDNNNGTNYSHISDLTLENYFRRDINKNENNLTKDEIINNIRNLISNRNTNLNSIIGENNNLLSQDNDIIYQITTLDKLKNNENNNISTLNLDKCENILKEIYNIDKNYSLVIFKVDYLMEGLLIPIIGYDIFHPLNNSLLDLNYY